MRIVWALVGVVAFAACQSSSPSDDDDGSSNSGAAGGGVPVPTPVITEQCEAQCIPMHPAGEVDYRNQSNCAICEACFDTCTTDFAEICPNGGFEGGCSQFQPTCGACVADPCTVLQQPDTTFTGYCAVLYGVCSLNIECVALNNCVASCIDVATMQPPMP
jgi:hypothetical protein